MGDKNFKESQALQRLFGQVRKAGGQGAWDRGAGGTQLNQQSTEQRRHECEARHILSLPFAERKPFLELVGKRRGAMARTALELEIRRQHRLAKVAA